MSFLQKPPTQLVGHTDPVYAIIFTPDGKQIITASFDNTLRLWDAATAKSLRTLEGHTRIVLSLALSKDGSTIASGSDDNTIKLWEVTPKTPPDKKKPNPNAYFASMSGHGGQVLGVAFTPDGKQLVSCSADKTVRVWDVAKKQQLKTLSTQGAGVYSIAFSPDGKSLATGGADKTVRLINFENGTEVRKFKGPEHEIYSVAFSPNGSQIAAGGVGLGDKRKVFLWNAGSEDPARTIDGHADDIYRVQFNPKGNRLLTIGYSGTINIWDVGNGKNLYQIKLGSVAYSGTYSPDGKRIAVASSDDKAYLLEVPAAAQ